MGMTMTWFLLDTKEGDVEEGVGRVTEILLIHQGVSEPMSCRISWERMKVKK